MVGKEGIFLKQFLNGNCLKLLRNFGLLKAELDYWLVCNKLNKYEKCCYCAFLWLFYLFNNCLMLVLHVIFYIILVACFLCVHAWCKLVILISQHMFFHYP